MGNSTLRPDIDATIVEPFIDPECKALRDAIRNEWRQSGNADLVQALRNHPTLTRDKSLLLTLAVDEYRARKQDARDADLEQYCLRFKEFGHSICNSILRQLEGVRIWEELNSISDEPRWPDIGEEFGDFVVCELLGIGGTSQVYLCRQREVGNRKVVVKATPYSGIEASNLGQLNHPNIVEIYSTGFNGDYGLHFLCMPYSGRSTLVDLLSVAFEEGCPATSECILTAAHRWIADGSESMSKQRTAGVAANGFRSYVDGILQLAIGIADALDHSHQHDILHGDLKPSNVLLTPNGQPLLLDFNLSQNLADNPAMRGGTLAYMPPEHLQIIAYPRTVGKHYEFDPAADIYSFGALLYEMLSGVPPVTLPEDVYDPQLVARQLLEQLESGVKSIRHRNRLVSKRLDRLVLECLSFSVSQRPKSMAVIKRRLQTDAGYLAAARRTARIRPYLFTSSAAILVTIAAAAAAYVANRPPEYLASYNKGLQAVADGDFEEATSRFTDSVASNLSFAPARFELGRARIATGDALRATADFYWAAWHGKDARSIAYQGYCFNLMGQPSAAIPCYEKAIERGASSAAIFNNLGASYSATGRVREPKRRPFLVEEYLTKALQMDPTSKVIRLNYVRFATWRSHLQGSAHPWTAWRYASSLIEDAPNDNVIDRSVAFWYIEVKRRNSDRKAEAIPLSEEERIAADKFEEVLERTDFNRIGAEASESDNFGNSSVIPSMHRYYLEPR